MFDYRDLGKLLNSHAGHSQTVGSREGELFMAVVMQNGQSHTCWRLRELSCAAVPKGGTFFEQHPLEPLFLCRIIGCTFWALCCGYQHSPLLFSQENIKPMAQLWFLSVLVSWSLQRSVFALFSLLPLQLKSRAWLWAACALDCWARGKTGFETANPRRVLCYSP